MKQNSLIDELPPWIDKDAWQGFRDMRKKMKKPMTDRAEGMLLTKLNTFYQQGLDVNAILDQSTFNNWLDVWPLKEESYGFTKTNQIGSADNRVRAAIEEKQRTTGAIDGKFRRH